MESRHTIHRLPLQLVPPIISADFELEFLLRVGDLPDLILVIDEVSVVVFSNQLRARYTSYACRCRIRATQAGGKWRDESYPSFSRSAGKTGSLGRFLRVKTSILAEWVR